MEVSSAESLELWASKVQGDWQGPVLVPQLTRERLQGLAHMFKEGKLENMVKVRLLLACLFLPRHELQSLHTELQALASSAREDEDEWVRVTGVAVGDYCGQLDTAALVDGPNSSSLVHATLSSLWVGLEGARTPPDFRPLQELYMHPEVLPMGALAARSSDGGSGGGGSCNGVGGSGIGTGAMAHAHFTPREGEDAARFTLAPPPLDQLLNGHAWLRVEGGKGARKATVQASKPAPLTMRDRQIAAKDAASHPPSTAPATTTATVAAPAAASTAAVASVTATAIESGAPAGVAGTGSAFGAVAGRALSVGAGTGTGGAVGGTAGVPLLGVRSSKLKPLELNESLQLSSQVSARAGRLVHGITPRATSTATTGPFGPGDTPGSATATAAAASAMDFDPAASGPAAPAGEEAALQVHSHENHMAADDRPDQHQPQQPCEDHMGGDGHMGGHMEGEAAHMEQRERVEHGHHVGEKRPRQEAEEEMGVVVGEGGMGDGLHDDAELI